MRKAFLAGLLLAATPVLALADGLTSGGSIACQRLGGITTCPDGTVYRGLDGGRFGGNDPLDRSLDRSPGLQPRPDGWTVGSDGTVYNRSGNITLDNKGNVYHHFGDRILGSNGTRCQVMSTQVVCN